MKTMPVITLWNPWAIWVAMGWKTIETRTHDRFQSLKGQWIGIHAGLKWDPFALHCARPYMTDDQVKQTEKFIRVGGAIICRAYVGEARWLSAWDDRRALIECSTPRFGLLFNKIEAIEAIPARGKQGIWYHDNFKQKQD
jgi:hypothetical protein